MRILGIETSCDETAAAVIHGTWNTEHGTHELKVLSNVVASQINIHAKTGGVVPEVAARAHAEKIVAVIEEALFKAAKVAKVPKAPRVKTSGTFEASGAFGALFIDAIAVTAGPGLMTALSVGVEAARTLSYLWKKPLVAVNHLAGHVYANLLPSPGLRPPSPLGRGKGEGNVKFPALALIVSGGHTELVLMKKHLDFKIIGSTRDDAAGEAFDKVAKMLGLSYPGGPAVSKLAAGGNPNAIDFPRPMITSNDFDFSFSGLKTAVLYWARDHKIAAMKVNPLRLPAGVYGQLPQSPTLPDLCASFEQAVVDVLVAKTIRAAKQYKVKTVLLGGGVAANKRLREQLSNAVNCELSSVNCVLPAAKYTGDNAAMIAAAGYFHALKRDFTSWKTLDVNPNWELGKTRKVA